MTIGHRFRFALRSVTSTAAIAIVVAFALSVAINRHYWGYWLSPPSLGGELAGAEIGKVELDDFGSSWLERGWTSSVKSCTTDVIAECAERTAGSLAPLRAICERTLTPCQLQRLFVAAHAGQSGAQAASHQCSRDLFQRNLRERPIPVVDYEYAAFAKPSLLISIPFQRKADSYCMFGYQTGQVSNDHYLHGEVVFRLQADQWKKIDEIRYFYDVAGIEGLEWPLFWPFLSIILFVLFGVCQLVYMYFRYLRRTLSRQKPVSA